MDNPCNDTECAAVLVGLLAIVRGYSNKKIGRELGMSRATVKNHLKHVFSQLNVRTRAEAVARAQEHGRLVSSGPEVYDPVRTGF